MEPDLTIESGAMVEPRGVRRSALGRGGGPLVRAVARAPVGVRTKHLVGFGVIVVLLVVVAAAGLVALRHSNSRVEQLRTEQQKTGLVRSLLADAIFLQHLVQSRAILTVPAGSKGVKPQPRAYYETIDSTIESAYKLLYTAANAPNVGNLNRAYLLRFYPSFERKMREKLQAFENDGKRLAALDVFGRGASATQLVHREQTRAYWFVAELGPLTRQAQLRANQVVAENRSSFASSRNLVIGVTAGSIALALALGLLISSSLLVPLRKTDARMAEIAAGDFTGHLEVPNRDEIGTLATNVNQMNDQLERLYGDLETASRHKSDFLATMSHELRTPLNAIIGFSEVLHEQMFGELNERQLAYVNDVLDAGRHLLSLINDVLDLAKIEAGRMELELSRVEIPELLRGAVSMQSERASRSGIELDLTTEPAEITVAADERRVRQVVFNLLSNAVKFTPNAGRIDVSARLDDGQVEIAIADTGRGIPRADLETIFEEFEQTSEGKQAEGAGLGLPLSRKLVELHGGRLWVESEIGRGSTFRFTLPVRHEAEA